MTGRNRSLASTATPTATDANNSADVAGSGRGVHNSNDETPHPRHYFVSAATLRRAARDAGVGELVAARVALGMPVDPDEHDRVLAALAGHGVDLSALPMPRKPPTPKADGEKRLTERSDR